MRESRERVRTAIRNAGLAFPSDRITVNLGPAGLRKQGTSFDLPIALGILTATRVVKGDGAEPVAVVGELALDGQIQPVRGVLAVGLACRRHRVKDAARPGGQPARGGGGGRPAGPGCRHPPGGRGPPQRGGRGRPAGVHAAHAPPGDRRRPRPRRRPGSGPRQAGPGGRRGRFPQRAAPGTPRRRQDDAGPAPHGHPPPADPGRVDRGLRHLERRRAPGIARPPAHAPVPGSASHHLALRAGRRRHAAPSGRGHPGPPGRAVPRRVATLRSTMVAAPCSVPSCVVDGRAAMLPVTPSNSPEKSAKTSSGMV